MNIHRFGAAVLLATTAVPAVACVAPVGAQAAADVDVGWWTRSPAQSAPEGGFAVASAPDGSVTVAAVVLRPGGVVVRGAITAEETGGVAQAAAPIIVCPTTDPVMLPEAGGSLEDAPEPDCERGSVPFERDAETLRWTADVSTLLESESRDDVSLALIPEPSDGPLQPAFDVRFAAPNAELVVASADADPDRPIASEDMTPALGSEPSSFPSGPAPPDMSPSPFEPGSSGDESVSTDSEVPVVPDEGLQEPTSTEQTDEFAVAPTARATAGTDPAGPGVGRAVSYVVISALAGAVVAGAKRFSRDHELRYLR